MNKFKLMAITALLVGPTAAQALTPWNDGAPDLTLRISGAVAQTNAYNQVVANVLAAPGTVDTFSDVDPATGSVGSN